MRQHSLLEDKSLDPHLKKVDFVEIPPIKLAGFWAWLAPSHPIVYREAQNMTPNPNFFTINSKKPRRSGRGPARSYLFHPGSHAEGFQFNNNLRNIELVIRTPTMLPPLPKVSDKLLSFAVQGQSIA
jgi:hypothetical protein